MLGVRVVVLCVLAAAPVLALVDGTSGPFVKFRYHGEPRVKCMNCKIRGDNLAPDLIGDGVVCAQVVGEENKWDCEVPKPVKRFRIAQNATQLEVVINPSTALTVVRPPLSLAVPRCTAAPPCECVAAQVQEEQTSWSFYATTAVGMLVLALGKLVIAFLRGPVSGHLTSFWLNKKKEH